MPEIRAILIFEMLGRPAEHLKLALEQFIERLSKEEGIEIANKVLHEPKKVEQINQELYTTFAEVEINFKDLTYLFKVAFAYMPSHIEIVSPQEIGLKNFELNTLMNEIARRLHQYDEIAKRLAIERDIFQRQLLQNGIKPAIPAAPSPQSPPPVPTPTQQKTKTKKIKKTGKKKKR